MIEGMTPEDHDRADMWDAICVVVGMIALAAVWIYLAFA